MKKLFFLTAVAVFAASSVFAQKSALRDAKRSLGGNDLNEARTLIKQATTNAETANDPETWKISGDIGNKAFDNERTNEMLGKQANQEVMYNGLLESYAPYLKADSLGELPDAKGKVKNRFRKDIAGILKANHPFYINGGIFFNEKQQYAKASDFFEIYWNIPSLPMFAGQKDAFLIDSTFQTIKYYAIITAIQAQDHKRALAMLKRAASEPFIANSAYQESDIYELIASEYIQQGDTAKYIETLYEGAEKFPQNGYFSGNIVNVLVRQGKNQEAIEYLDKAIVTDPSNPDYYRVKAALFSEKKDYKGAEDLFLKSLDLDPNFETSLEGLAVLYILQAQDLKEKTATMSDRKLQLENDKQTVHFYQKSLPYLEKFTQSLKDRSADKTEIESALMKLRNVYYNLSMMGVDKSAELKQVEAELGL